MRLYNRIALLVLSIVRIALSQDLRSEDITNNGNYLIARCGKNIPGGKADQLVSLLREIGEDLPTIIVYANTGTSSDYGFKSLFTSNDAVPVVTANYGKLSDAESVLIDGRATQITFVCFEPGDPVPDSVYHTISTQPRGAAFNEFGSEKIYLTPFFFNHLRRSPEPYRCPIFRRSHIAINGDDILGTTQYGVIIHELMDKYLHFDYLE
ncbi:MAG: hypothetical protein Q9225_004976 [Loekoesia sp. 1 TL-2023]